MAITGTWAQRKSVQAGARKWGTGYNPVHEIRDNDGRNIAVTPTEGTIPSEVTVEPSDLYTDEDYCSGLWGYDIQDGTADRPSLGTNTQDFRGENTNDFPEWGPYVNGIPGGTTIRDRNHGATLNETPKQNPSESVSEGWLNKVTGSVSDSTVSDTNQLFVQTSSRQRDAVRAGSQVPEGRENEFDQPIRSRIPGKIVKVYSGGERHYDMEPRSQDEIIRPWWNREAGTGRVHELKTNDAYESVPLTRDIPADPYTGVSVPTSETFGFTDEDMIPYA